MNALNQLITALRCLPGVGPKSAQRMVFHLLQHQREQGMRLAESLQNAMTNILHCESCHNFSETPLCDICKNPTRNTQQICIVETPAELASIESSRNYNGLYFVLMGKISPLDGIGPQDLHLDKLVQKIINSQQLNFRRNRNEQVEEVYTQCMTDDERVSNKAENSSAKSIDGQITEVIVALSPTIEGQTTLHFIQTLLKPLAVEMTQLAYGLPSGGEIEYLDSKTIGYALENRRHVAK